MLVNATSPSGEETAPPLRLVSPFQSCHAQKSCAAWVLNPSGWVPCGDRMTYWASRLEPGVVLPKWVAALIASCASWAPVAWGGEGALSSTHTPASAPPCG